MLLFFLCVIGYLLCGGIVFASFLFFDVVEKYANDPEIDKLSFWHFEERFNSNYEYQEMCPAVVFIWPVFAIYMLCSILWIIAKHILLLFGNLLFTIIRFIRPESNDKGKIK